MSDSLKYWEESNFGEEKKETEITQNIQTILDLERLLSPYERVLLRKELRKLDIF